MPTTEITQPQASFIRSLVTSVSTKLDAAIAINHPSVEGVNAKVATVQATIVRVLQNDPEVSISDASKAITTLKDCEAVLKDAERLQREKEAPAKAQAEHPGIVGAQRVITNKFSKRCSVCGTTVATGAGHAALVSGSWATFCAQCASETPADRAARIAALDAEAAAAAAQEAAETKALQASFRRIIKAAGSADLNNPKVRVAIPSPRSDQDLDFFVVTNNYVARFIGGQGETPMNRTQCLDAVKRIWATDIPAAMMLFGQKLEFCGRCGRPLTVQSSRDNGLGPDCFAAVTSGGMVIR